MGTAITKDVMMKPGDTATFLFSVRLFLKQSFRLRSEELKM